MPAAPDAVLVMNFSCCCVEIIKLTAQRLRNCAITVVTTSASFFLSERQSFQIKFVSIFWAKFASVQHVNKSHTNIYKCVLIHNHVVVVDTLNGDGKFHDADNRK